MLTTLLLALALTAADPPPVDFSEVRDHIHNTEWSKARRVLNRMMMEVVEGGGRIDGGDLVQAVRLRALIESGDGNPEDAVFWWHAGLNLYSDKAESFLELVSSDVAEPLRAIQVRPSDPPKPLKIKPVKHLPSKPTALERLARQKLSGMVKIEALVDTRPSLPLLIEATSPTAGVYVALDMVSRHRILQKLRVQLGTTQNHFIRFRGQSSK